MQEDQTGQENQVEEIPNQENSGIDEERLSDVAHHEAAHAVIGILEGLSCKRIAITNPVNLDNVDFTGNYEGDFEINNLTFTELWNSLSNNNCSEDTRNTAESLIRIAVAGSYAQIKCEENRKFIPFMQEVPPPLPMLETNNLAKIQNDHCDRGGATDFIIAIKTLGLLNNIEETIDTGKHFKQLIPVIDRDLKTQLLPYANGVINNLNQENIWQAVEQLAQTLMVAPNKRLEGSDLNSAIELITPLINGV